MSSKHFFGIRHHGPGCARALEQALTDLQPDCILLEGPVEASPLVQNLDLTQLSLPVALLVYAPEQPGLAVFYPFAEFSPEWQAIQYARRQQVPLEFIDLPLSHELALQAAELAETAAELAVHDAEPVGFSAFAALAAIEGDPEDPEGWWEVQIEQRQNADQLFSAINELMTALREQAPLPSLHELRREASMRQQIRAAEKAGHQRIAIVCGAWHLPALQAKTTQKDDQALLKALPKLKTAQCWIPWSNDRLALASGYGAGIEAPNWYQHCWCPPTEPVVDWLVQAAQRLRAKGWELSSASVIEASRLAYTLAALRNRSQPRLRDLNDAMLSLLGQGSQTQLRQIQRQLEIGERLGRVEMADQQLPLQQELAAEQKRLRLKPSTEVRTLELDLRDDSSRELSQLLHRLNLLNLPWGTLQRVSGKQGTFHEHWRLQWQPEFELRLIDASRFGNRLDQAASTALCQRLDAGLTLPELTQLLDESLLARLPQAQQRLLQALRNQAAVATDILHLMQSFPPLSRIARYGDVRNTQAMPLQPILDSLLERILIGLPMAASGLNPEAASQLLEPMQQLQASLDTLADPSGSVGWGQCLRGLMTADAVAPVIAGYSVRLLFERQQLDDAELRSRTQLALSDVVPPLEAAAWLTGLLRGSGLMLLNQAALWPLLDAWLSGLDSESFQTLLPLLRRSFADFTLPERQRMLAKVQQWHSGQPTHSQPQTSLDPVRAARVVPVLRQILGGAL